MAVLQYLFFWNLKTPQDNRWHPQIGQDPNKYIHHHNLPAFLQRTDAEATLVDAAPFIAGAGGLRHVSQIHHFGFTARASVFRNAKTMTAMHRACMVVPLILVAQAAQIEYRTFIPRWCHERELYYRDEAEVRKHVDVGACIGAVSWIFRLTWKVGARYWAPIDVVIGGGLCDLLHREYIKAHTFETR